MKTPPISIAAYEAAERDLLLAHSRRVWRLHATTFGIAFGALILVETLAGGASWLAYLVLALWAVVVGFHYRGWVRYGDARIREQQSRIEWRAGRSNERLIPKSRPAPFLPTSGVER